MLLTAQMLQERFKWFVLAGTVAQPVNYYGLSKHFAEEMVAYECKKREAGLRVLRFANITGLGENKAKLLSRAVEYVRTGTPFTINAGAFPAEYVCLDRAVNEVCVAAVDCENGLARQSAKRVVDGIIRNQKQLMEWARNVADSNAKAA